MIYYVIHPVADMREAPSHESKIISQAIFSEEIRIAKEANGWLYCMTPDGYSGWISSEAITSRNNPYSAKAFVSRLKAHLYKRQDLDYGPLISLPYGAALQPIDQNERWTKIKLPNGTEAFIQNGDIEPEFKLQNKEELAPFSLRFLGLPYTWGGRSSFGYDCSGLIQALYQKIGICLQRDAKQQILDKRLRPIPVSKLEPGDLIFFGQSEQSICHVALFLGKHKIIHATARENLPWCRISHLSDLEWSGKQGIWYSFRTARRLFLP
ncbi:MAG TPA: NlpC/P60 family protein [Chlamydiales bacterium]|nr:NlpC/P60 family protein [Chlamydiales bacterium]